MVELNRINSSFELPGAYFACQRRPQGVCGLEIQFHHMCATMILSLWRGSLRPSPLADFGRQTSVHLTKAHFLLWSEEPQRKFLWRLRIFLRTHFGAAKIENIYRGMAWRTDLMRIILLAMLRERKVQEESLVSKLSRRVLQEACLISESNRGAPRYFKEAWLLKTPESWQCSSEWERVYGRKRARIWRHWW